MDILWIVDTIQLFIIEVPEEVVFPPLPVEGFKEKSDVIALL